MSNKLLLTTAVSLAMTIGAAHAAGEKSSGLFLEPAAEADFASELIGTTVYDRSGDDAQSIGEINDLIIAEDGSVSAAILGVGGFLGMGEKSVAVSFDALEMTKDDDGDRYVILATTKEELQAAPAFDYDTAMAPAMDNAPDPDAAPKRDQAMSDQPTDDATTDITADDEQAAVKRSVPPDREGLKMAEAASVSADNLIGVTVYGADNESIGEVSDVILAKDGGDGAIEAVILDVGGFLGIGEKPVAVSFDSLEIMVDEGNSLYAYSKFTQEQLEAAAEYDPDTYEMNRETMLVRPQG
ncbi:MAG TPA: PRC-barrel domain-containing protein [Bauldia sp.]|nr:PRC-barrel domain-containing protein [Bauldia sp.]